MSMKQVGSVTTINPKATSSQMSGKHTDSGAATALSTEMRQAAVARLLEIDNPAEADKRLVSSLESISNSRVVEQTKTRFTDSEAVFTTHGFEIKLDTLEQCDKAERAVRASMASLSVDEITNQLALLAALVVKPSGESVDDYTFRMNAIAMQLTEYPADIVMYAIKQVSKTSTFWPAYAEFHKHIDWRLHKRKLLLRAIEQQRRKLLT